jgi:DNA-directed RNA polymerase specialized sigma24 family protein
MSKLEEEFVEPYEAWKAKPSPVTAGALLKSVDPILKTAMRSYGGGSGASPTLRSQAKQLTIEAFPTYDPQRGSMKSHLMGHLQRLHRLSGQEQQIIRLPERVAMDRIQVDSAVKELEDRFGRPPSEGETADYTGLSRQRLAYIRQADRPVAEGTMLRPTEEGAGMYMPAVEQPTAEQSTWLEFVYDDLTPTDQFIMERMLAMHGHRKMNVNDIAARLRITPGAVSQRLARIQQKLDKVQDAGLL